MQSTEAAIEAYLGGPGTRPQRSDAWTVRGWASASVTAVTTQFAELLDDELRSGNLDPASGLPYTLGQRPLWLLDSVEMLAELRSLITAFKDAAQAALAWERRSSEKCASTLDERRSRLLAAPRSADLQRAYLRSAQDQFDLRVWQALMEAWIQVADAWLGAVDRWLTITGDGASGWLAHLRAQDDDVRSRAEVLLAERRKLAVAANHRYMPGVGGAGELALLDRLVSGSGAVTALLEHCRFAWHQERDGAALTPPAGRSASAGTRA